MTTFTTHKATRHGWLARLSLLLMATALLGTLPLKAQTKYPLYVGGVQVTDANKANIAKGVSYNSGSKVLTLNNANIVTSVARGIDNQGITNFRIQLVGTNTVTSTATNGIGIAMPKPGSTTDVAYIQGTGSLNVTGTATGIYADQAHLIIQGGCTIIAKGGTAGIRGFSSKNAKLTINNSYVKAKATDAANTGSISWLSTLTLSNATYAAPANATFKPQVGVCIGTSTTATNQEVYIVPAWALYVAGKRVTALNKDNILKGVSYNSGTKVLTLNNATITSTGATLAIENKSIANLIINLVGINTVNADQFGIAPIGNGNGNATIQGSGTLNVTSKANYALYVHQGSLTISGTCTINAKAEKLAICGYQGTGAASTGKITINAGPTVKATGKTGSIAQLKTLTLTGCAISKPARAAFDQSKQAVALNGKVVTDEVIIAPSYNLKVADITVTTHNADNILGDAAKSVSYNATGNTLTLNNAKIESDNYGIESNIANLNVVLVGENTVNASTKGKQAIRFNANATIKGSGKLNTLSQNASAIYAYKVNLTIQGGCTIIASGKTYGFSGQDGTGILTIDNCNVKAVARQAGAAIGDLGGLTLTNCIITSPDGASFNKTQKGVIKDGKLVANNTPVNITPAYDLWVQGTQVTTANQDNILGKTTFELVGPIGPGGPGGIGGGMTGSSSKPTVSYDPTSNTLTLRKAEIKSTLTTTMGIKSNMRNLNIQLVGATTIEVSNVGIYGATKIYGSGSLNVTSTKEEAIKSWNSLSIEGGCSIIAKGNTYGITSGPLLRSLTVKNSTLKATGTTKGSIANITGLNLSGCSITSPTGADYRTAQKAVATEDGTIIKGEVVIMPPYTISIATDIQNGSLATSPANSADANEVVTIIPSPSTDYRLKEGSLKVYNTQTPATTVNVTNSTFKMPAYNVTVTGEFEKLPAATFAIICSTPANGSLSTTPANSAQSDTEITINAQPDDGYQLKEGTLIAYNPDNAKETVTIKDGKFTMPRHSVAIEAEFVPVPHTITIAAGIQNGSLSTAPAGDVAKDVEVTINAAPDRGFQLKDGSLKVVKTDDPNTTVEVTEGKFTMPAYNVTVSAEFEADGTTTEYAITIAEGIQNGSVSTSPAEKAAKDTEVTITTTPNDGYKLKEGSIKVVKTDDPNTTVTVNGDKFTMPAFSVNVTAEFEAIPYTIAIAGDIQNGKLTTSPIGTATIGTLVSISYEAMNGYRPKDGSIKVVKEGTTEEVTVTNFVFEMPASNVTVSAVFEALPAGTFAIAIAPAVQNGSVSTDPSLSAAKDTEVTIYAEPFHGYKLKEGSIKVYKTDDPNTAVPVNGDKFTMPEFNVTVSAEFEADGTTPPPATTEYAITIAEGIQNGSVSTSPAEKAAKDTEVTITTTPKAGYKLKEGSIKVVKTDDPNTPVTVNGDKFTMPEFNVTVSAEFEAAGNTPNPDPKPTPTPVDANEIAWRLAVDGQTLIILDAEGQTVELYNLAGIRLHRTDRAASNSLRIAAPQPGIYIVRVGNSSRKVVIQ